MENQPSLTEHFLAQEISSQKLPTSDAHQDISPITVLQWNILAGHLSDSDAFPQVPAEQLKMEDRLPRIVSYLKHPSLQFICLEEVDVSEEIKAALGPGWGWTFAKKSDQPDGTLLGYRTHPEFEWELVTAQ